MSVQTALSRPTLLAGDMGGTKTLLAIYSLETHGLQQQHLQRYVSAEWPSLEPMLESFLKERPDGINAPTHGCIAVAGPVRNRSAQITNLPWRLQEQPRSVVPGRSGRKYYQYVPGPPGRRKPFDGRREVPLLPLFDNPLTPEYEAPPRQDAYRWPPDRGSSK